MGWNSNPSDGVSFSEGTVTFPSNYGSEDKVYTLTYSDSGLTSNTFTVTVKHITMQLEISSDAYLLDGPQESNFTITYAKKDLEKTHATYKDSNNIPHGNPIECWEFSTNNPTFITGGDLLGDVYK